MVSLGLWVFGRPVRSVPVPEPEAMPKPFPMPEPGPNPMADPDPFLGWFGDGIFGWNRGPIRNIPPWWLRNRF